MTQGRDQSQGVQTPMEMAQEFARGAFGPFGVDTAPYAAVIAELIELAISQHRKFPPAAQTKSAPVADDSLPSGESGPMATSDCSGADTTSLGEGELLREALAFTFFKTRGHARYRTDADALFKKAKLPDAGNTVGGAFLREVSEAFADADIALAALTPAPRDQGSIQATSSASATVCDHPAREPALVGLLKEIDPGLAAVLQDNAGYVQVVRRNVIEECARFLERTYPDHAWLNAACAALRSLKAPSAASLIANQKNLRGSEPETAPAGDASSRCDTGSKVR